MKCLGIHLGRIEMNEWPQSDIIHAETKTSQHSPCLDCCSEHWRYFITRTHGVWKSPKVCNQVVSCTSFFFFLFPFGCRRLSQAFWGIFFITFDHLTHFCEAWSKNRSLLCYNPLFVCSSVLSFSSKIRQASNEQQGTFTLLTHIKSEQIVTQHLHLHLVTTNTKKKV